MESLISPDAELWRRKYFESLEYLERRERQWREQEALFRRRMSRLTLLGDGADPKPDCLLERMQNMVREERDAAGIRAQGDDIAQTALGEADTVREAVQTSDFLGDGGRIPVTLSAGIARDLAGDSGQTVLKHADQALYEAKAAGRNCCRAADV